MLLVGNWCGSSSSWLIRQDRDEEQVRTQASLEAALRDSRLGYKLVEDYVYSPAVLEKKLQVLARTLEEEIPGYRKEHNIP